ncbi:MAG: DUF3347 domain-containing protein [Chitinophagaceae bacterium]
MKNIILIFFTAINIVACNGPDVKVEEPGTVSKTQRISNHSDTFNQSFEKMLMSYFFLKDALVEYDTLRANAAAKELAYQAENLPLPELADSVGAETAKNYSGTISGSALGLVGETDFGKKKKEFQMISDAMYDLVRTVNFDRQIIYHQHCPMAFNDSEGAYWLSNSRAVINPYLGKKHPKYKAAMLACGEVTDSLDFSGR